MTRSLVVVVLAVCLWASGRCDAGERSFVDYLSMEPNEGGSSAGHVAIAFGDRTYAYQRGADGLLVLERDATEHVRWLYAVLGNRAVHRSRVAVTPEVFARLREGFNRRYLVEQHQLELRDRLIVEARLLRTLTARARDPFANAADGIAIEAAGYFADGGSPALRVLADDVRRAYGADFVDRRVAELRTRLGTIVPDERAAPPALTLDTYPENGDRFLAQYGGTLGAMTGLATLRAGPGLDAAGLVTVDDDAWTDGGATALERYGARLRGALVRLAGSTRADGGFPLLVGMARLAAIERSLVEHRLVVLDAYPPAARRLPAEALARAPEAAQGLVADARDDLAHAWRRLGDAAEPDERAYAALEAAANRYVEVRRGVTEHRDVRITTEAMVPVRAAIVTDLVVPSVALERLRVASDAAEEHARAYARAFDVLHRYDLVRRNCVTETFRTVDAVLGSEADAALGGRIGVNAWRAIPAVATRTVRRRWKVAASDVTPSYRSERVAALARAGNPVAVRLRESNTLTSTVYRRSRDDSTFLFFTDDVVALRPLLGAANLGVGIGATLVGLAQAPLDRGHALLAGLQGVLWSLPELFFVNVRKGSFDHVARNAPQASLPWRESPPPSPR